MRNKHDSISRRNNMNMMMQKTALAVKGALQQAEKML